MHVDWGLYSHLHLRSYLATVVCHIEAWLMTTRGADISIAE